MDVLTDVLGSAVATASDGVISADLQLFGDFGDSLTTPKVDTVTGFTGKIDTAGLVEFAARTFDPATRQWVQDDRYRGTTTRAASMNRYAYVEGAPESFVDHLGFFRAAAALQAQQLAALQAALASEFEEFQQVYSNQVLYGQGLTVKQMMASYNALHASDDPIIREVMDKIAREAFYDVTQVHSQQKLQARYAELQAQAVRQNKLNAIARQYQAEQLQIQAEADSLLFYQTTIQTVNVLKDPSFAVHSVLDVVGMVPVFGEVADLVNAGIYAAEGNYLDASLSLAGMVPFAGMAVTGARMVKNTVKTVNKALDVANVASDAFRVADGIPLNAATPPIATLGKLPEVPTMKAPDLASVTMPDVPAVKAPDVPTVKAPDAAPVGPDAVRVVGPDGSPGRVITSADIDLPSRTAVDQQIPAGTPAPAPLKLEGRTVGRSDTQNVWVQDEVARLEELGATDIRIDQTQVDFAGNRVGANRPDLQYSLDGQRVAVELDIAPAPRAIPHAARILANDPTVMVILHTTMS